MPHIRATGYLTLRFQLIKGVTEKQRSSVPHSVYPCSYTKPLPKSHGMSFPVEDSHCRKKGKTSRKMSLAF
jgi:hypothetical protein